VKWVARRWPPWEIEIKPVGAGVNEMGMAPEDHQHRRSGGHIFSWGVTFQYVQTETPYDVLKYDVVVESAPSL
jgi:hypothetical protein